MTEQKNRIYDFVAHANEKSLNRILQVIENIESPVLAYTHTGEPILHEDLATLSAAKPGVIAQQDLNKRMAVLNGLNAVAEVLA